ncbi:MAG: NYN domain-containing protein [Leptolyngbyaceae cyanobacterium bins.59]|nr:NYN domain-containing protein [Leptolyngbyaceae cyanobacterium bins.59]
MVADLLERAKQGEPQAIATLMGRSLHSKGLKVAIHTTAHSWQILFEAEQIPDRHQLSQFVKQGFLKLGITPPALQVMGRQKGSRANAWTIDLFPTTQTAPMTGENKQTSISQSLSASSPSPLSTRPDGIAILLLDAENLYLRPDEREFLESESVCPYPIRVKIAFANWRVMGKRDEELYEQGYQMIHVPQGKNSADMKMTAIGASMFLQYPNTKAMIVCSSDSDLSHLHHTLQSQGIGVYKVIRRNRYLEVTLPNGKTLPYLVREPEETSQKTGELLEQELVQIIQTVMAETPGTTALPISVVGDRYRRQYGKSVAERLQELELRERHCGSFLRSRPQVFQVQVVNRALLVSLVRSDVAEQH